jgi:hypothetical protein
LSRILQHPGSGSARYSESGSEILLTNTYVDQIKALTFVKKPFSFSDDEFGTDEDNEKEFEPTVDMIMNEFDDERTIDEEEAMGQEDEQEELNALEKEQDIPLEELLKLYGYSQPPPTSNPEKEKNPVPAPEDEEEEEEEEEEENSLDEKDDPSESDTDCPKGEKRGASSPPPPKKSKSELAK